MTHAPRKKQQSADLPRPPDGGWGWVVVFASFMIHIVTDGVTYSFGVFYVQFLEYFNEGKGATAWIASILVGVTLCSGPISSAFVNKYGCRPVTIVGAVLASLGMVASAFARNVVTLYFTIGIGTGLGFGLIYLPAIVSVTCYFEKYRSLATGIAVCGSGLGTFIFAPFTEWLVSKFGWRGAMLIIGALVMNCVIFGILFRPLEAPKPRKGKLLDTVVETPGEEEMAQAESAAGDDEVPKRDTSGASVVANGGPDVQRRPHSVHAFTLPPRHHQSNGYYVAANGKNAEVVRATLSQPMLLTVHDGHSRTRHQSEGSTLRATHSGVMYRKDVLYRGSLANIPQHNRSATWIHSDVDQPEEKALMQQPSSATAMGESDQVVVCGCFPCHKETRDTLREMLDLSLLKDPIFIVFTISNFCTSIGFSIPYVYIVAQAEKQGISENYSSYLLSVIGIANTVGRIILGYLSDKPWVNRLWVYNVCLTVCGISTVLSAFCYDFLTFSIYSTAYGFTIGAYVGLTSVILVDLLGLNKLTNAFGLLLLFQGIASLLGPPIAGWLYDALDSYNPGFIVAGVTIAISGLMLFVIPSMQRCLARSHRNKNEIVMDNS